MSNDAAILLTINLEGVLSQMREEVTINVTEEKEFMSLNPETKKLEKKSLVKRYEKQHFQRIPSAACKKTTISQMAVDYMLSNEVPDWYKAKRNKGKQWHELSTNEKLDQHFARIAYPHTFSYVFIDV